MCRLYSLPFAALLLAGCSRTSQPAADPGLLAEIQQIRAIDNHAHPVRVTSAGEPPDRGFDALPVDSMLDPDLFPSAEHASARGQPPPPSSHHRHPFPIADFVPNCRVPYADALLFPLDKSAARSRCLAVPFFTRDNV
jgi:hypothetical protein